MRHRSVGILGILAVSVLVPGCDLLDPAGAAEVAQVSLRLELDPAEIGPGDSTEARIRLINEGLSETKLAVGQCLGTLGVRKDQVAQDFQIAPEACWAVGSSLTLPVGDTLTQAWTVRAASSADQPAAAGDYVVYVVVDAELSRGTRLGDVVSPLAVR